jgi:hypothetical protein
MISLPCTHCQRVLTIDEAFAGGVCRCQHCGTIQTVPAHLREGNPEQPGPSGRSLYKHPRTGGDSHVGTGLANLSDETAEPAATGKRERARAPRAASPADPTEIHPPARPWTLYAALGGIVAAGLFLIWLILRLT